MGVIWRCDLPRLHHVTGLGDPMHAYRYVGKISRILVRDSYETVVVVLVWVYPVPKITHTVLYINSSLNRIAQYNINERIPGYTGTQNLCVLYQVPVQYNGRRRHWSAVAQWSLVSVLCCIAKFPTFCTLKYLDDVTHKSTKDYFL